MSNLRFANVRLTSGVKIHYAEQGDVDGEPIVLLHGWPDSWFSFSRVLPLLSPRLRALVPDQRGFGDLEKLSAGYDIADFAADAIAFLDAMSIERATFVGHSFGSFVARRIAITNPQRIARMVLIGTGLSDATPDLLEIRSQLKNLPEPVPTAFARDFQASTAYAPLPESFFDRIVDESLKAPATVWQTAFEGLLAYNDVEELSRISAPTQLIWGERDALFSMHDQHRLSAAIQGAKLLSYPETGHCPNWERPERLAADLNAFILNN